MVNNFDLISSYIKDLKGKYFYDCAVIRRGKDHPELPSANYTIKSYFINSPENLLKNKNELISLAELFGARVYINLAPKSYEKLAKLTNFRLSERIFNGDYKKIYKCFTSCAGELKGEHSEWIVDIDYNESDISLFDTKIKLVSNFINNWFEEYNTFSDKDVLKSIHLEVPTKSGVHLITDSFNLRDFKKEFPDIDVHKNNPTLLYAN